MDEEFLQRPRMSRIYWNGKFLDYPLKGMDVIKKLGPIELTRCACSPTCGPRSSPRAARTTSSSGSPTASASGSTSTSSSPTPRRCGACPRTELRAEWAAQRIKGLSFFSAAKAAFFGNKGNKIKSLIDEFHYPRFGPGQMWETMADEISAHGGEVRLNAPVTKLEVRRRPDRRGRTPAASASSRSHVISSLPLRATVGIAEPDAPGRRSRGRARACATATS